MVRLRRFHDLPLILFFAALYVAFSFLSPRFNSATNIENLLAGYSFMAILALGESLPILTRGIDLSIGSNAALAGMVLYDGSVILRLPGALLVPAALAISTAAGVVNGLLVIRLRLQPFVATLATLAAYRGSVYAISGRQLFPELATRAIDDGFVRAFDGELDLTHVLHLEGVVDLPFVPYSFFLMVALLVVAGLTLARTRLGLDLKAVGGNPEAARLAGIRVGRVIVMAYGASGFCAGVAAVILVARLTTSTEALGTGMELAAVAAAVIGGVSLQGGVGNALGPCLGAFLLGVILVGLTLGGFSQYVQQVITGAILVAAVWYDRVLSDRRQRRAERLQERAHAAA